MKQAYPTREHILNMIEGCSLAEVPNWSFRFEEMLAMHDEIDSLKALVREMRPCLNRNMPVTDRLWETSRALLGEAKKSRED